MLKHIMFYTENDLLLFVNLHKTSIEVVSISKTYVGHQREYDVFYYDKEIT